MATDTEVVEKYIRYIRYAVGVAMCFTTIIAGNAYLEEKDLWDLFATVVFIAGAYLNFSLAYKKHK